MPAIERFAGRLRRPASRRRSGATAARRSVPRAGSWPRSTPASPRRSSSRAAANGSSPRARHALRGERSHDPVPAGVGELTVADAAPRRVLIAASILDADLANLGDEIRRARGRRAPTGSTSTSWTATSCPTSRSAGRRSRPSGGVTRLPFDAHLMISEPGALDAASSSMPAATRSPSTSRSKPSPDPADPGADPRRRALRPGLSVKPATPLAALDAATGTCSTSCW